jgi:hypothetical protein
VKYGLGVVRVTVLATVAALAALLAAAPGEAATVKRTGARNWELTVPTPPSPDITVVRLTFPLGRFSAHPTRSPLSVRALSNGIDLSASGGRLFPWRRGRIDLLVVLAHRHPPGALYPDAAGLRFAVSGARLTRRPVVDEVLGAFAHRSSASPVAPALCRDRSGKVSDAMVRALVSGGPDLGFTPAHVMSEGYDVACSRPVDPAFERAFTEYGRCSCQPPPPQPQPCPPPCQPGVERPCPEQPAAYPCIQPL